MSAVKLDDARRVISAAEKKAREIRQPMNIAVADEGGNIVTNIRMDNAWIGSIDISMKKAYTSRAFDIENHRFGKAFTVRRPVLRHSCVKRWQDHDFRWRHPAEARWQSSRCNRCQRWERRSGPCRRDSWRSCILMMSRWPETDRRRGVRTTWKRNRFVRQSRSFC